MGRFVTDLHRQTPLRRSAECALVGAFCNTPGACCDGMKCKNRQCIAGARRIAVAPCPPAASCLRLRCGPNKSRACAARDDVCVKGQTSAACHAECAQTSVPCAAECKQNKEVCTKESDCCEGLDCEDGTCTFSAYLPLCAHAPPCMPHSPVLLHDWFAPSCTCVLAAKIRMQQNC